MATQLPTPVFWPGEFSPLYSPWGHKESDKTEQLSPSLHFSFIIEPFLPKGSLRTWLGNSKNGLLDFPPHRGTCW